MSDSEQLIVRAIAWFDPRRCLRSGSLERVLPVSGHIVEQVGVA